MATAVCGPQQHEVFSLAKYRVMEWLSQESTYPSKEGSVLITRMIQLFLLMRRSGERELGSERREEG